MKKKLLATLALTCALTAGLGLFAACGETETTPLAFVEGYANEIDLGESMLLREYVDTSVQGYTLVATMGDQEIDLTGKATWSPENAGVWTLTYTVGEQSVQATITIKAPPITWSYTNTPIFFEGTETIQFATVLENMNIVVQSVEECEVFMESVSVNGEVTDLTGQTSYTFETPGIYTFRFTVVSADGQTLSATVIAAPKTDEPFTYVERGNVDMLINSVYMNGQMVSSIVDPEYVKEGIFSDKLTMIHTREWTGFGFSGKVLREIFSDPYVCGFEYYMYNANVDDAPFVQYFSVAGNETKEEYIGTLKAGEWTRIYFSREMYQQMIKALPGFSGDNCGYELKIIWEGFNAELGTENKWQVYYLDACKPVMSDTPYVPEEGDGAVKDFAEATNNFSKGYGGSQVAVNTDTNFVKEGETSISNTATGTGGGFAFTKNAFQELMTAANVTEISFELYATAETTMKLFYTSKTLTTAEFEAARAITLPAGEWKKITISKAMFDEAWSIIYAASASAVIDFQLANMEAGDVVYLDNIQIITDGNEEGEETTADFGEALTNFSAGYGGSQIGLNTESDFAKEGTTSIKNTVTDAGRGAGFAFKKNFFQELFMDESVTEISFEIYVTADTTFKLFNTSTTLTTAAFESARIVNLKAGEWTKITITRAMLDESWELIYKNSASAVIDFKITDVEVGEVIYFDNIQVVKANNE